MTRQHRFSQSFKSIGGAALVALGLLILFGALDGSACQLSNLLGTAVRETLELLPSLGYAFDHQGLSSCSVQMLVSFLPLLGVMAGAA